MEVTTVQQTGDHEVEARAEFERLAEEIKQMLAETRASQARTEQLRDETWKILREVRIR